MSTTESVETPSIELHGSIEPGGQADATMAIRWCVTPGLAKVLRDADITKPFLLLSIRPYTTADEDSQPTKYYGNETKRYVVPLSDEMQYISFSRPGLNSVTACVVWAETGGRSTVDQVFLSRFTNSGAYKVGIYGPWGRHVEAGEHREDYGRYTYEATVLPDVSDEITVDVSPDMFAKELPQWKKDYLGKFFSSRPFDECHNRKRWLLFGLPFSPFFLVFGYTSRIFQSVVGAWLGLSPMHVRSFAHPLRYGISDVWTDVDRSVWFVGKNKRWRLPPFWLLNPISPIILALAFFSLGSIHVTRNERVVHWHEWGLWKCLAIAVLAHLSVAAFLIVVLLLLGLISVISGSSISTKIGESIEAWRTAHKTQRRKERERKAAEKHKADAAALHEALEQMFCSGQPTRVSLDALPKNKRTIRLRFQNTKSKVCRPFAR